MKNFFDKLEYNTKDIKTLIENKAEESMILEFKDSAAIGNTDRHKKEISKDVSSFANSSGGIIVYGITENNHVATSLSFIDGKAFTKEWMEQVIQSNIQRKIEGLEIIPIRFNNKMSESIYLIKIPLSNSSPHMAKDNRYYRRYNFESVPMEEYEVRNLYNKTEVADLSISDLVFQTRGGTKINNKFQYLNYDIQLKIDNLSNSVGNSYKIVIELKTMFVRHSNSDPSLEFMDSQADITRITFPNESAIYPGESCFTRPVRVHFRKRTFDNHEDLIIKVYLYYSNRTKVYEYDLSETLKLNDELLNMNHFIDA